MTTAPDLSTAVWRTSSYSNGDGGACVEVADSVQDTHAVRDTKRRDDGPVLVFHSPAWTAFIATVK